MTLNIDALVIPTELNNNIVSQNSLTKNKGNVFSLSKVSIAFLTGLFKTFYCK